MTTHGSGIVSSACGTRGAGEACETCMCLAWSGVGGEWAKRLGFTNPARTEGALDVRLCLGHGGMGGACEEWTGGLDQGLEGVVVLCLCEM